MNMEENAGRTNLNRIISKTFSFLTFMPRLLYILRTLFITKALLPLILQKMNEKHV